jgi:starch synthase
MRAVHLLRKLDPAEWSGTETAIHRLVEGLRAQGVKPVVYCPALEGDRNGDPLVHSGFEVQRFRAFVPILGLSQERRRQLVSVGGNLMSFGLISALRRDKEIDVLHTHTLGRIGGIARTVAKQRGIPFIVTIHGGVFDLPEKIKQSFNAPIEKGWEWGKLFGWMFQSHALFRDADAILTCNPKEASLLRERLPEKKIVVQPHGVPLELYRPDHRSAALAAFPQIRDRDMILSLGRIDPIKNQSWLVEQAPALFAKHPNALIVLAGPCTDEPYEAKLKQRIRQLGLEQRVLFTGGMAGSDPRLIGLLQSARALVLPSLSETFGLVVLEAWAAGTMVLSSRTSGPSALIQNGSNGWLFELEKPAEFHEAVAWTLAHPAEAEQMVERGARVSEQYGLAAIAAKVKSLYEELVEEKACAT